MNYEEAKELLDGGKKVRLPEWTGYWFAENQDISKPFELTIKAFTRTGDIVDACVDKYKDRDDWEEVTEGLRFDWASLAAKSGNKVKRSHWPGFMVIEDEEVRLKYINSKTGHLCYDDEWIESDDILATDWVLAD